jgi:small ligand-binding sensory domain FIST
MRWVSVATHVAPEVAASDGAASCIAEIRGALKRDPDLLWVGVTLAYASAFPELMRCFRLAFPRANLVGAVASGVIGPDGEREGGPAMVALAASLPDVTVSVVRLPPDVVARLGPDAQIALLEALRGAGDPVGLAGAIALVDARGTDVAGLVSTLGAALPGLPIVGGVLGDGATASALAWGQEIGRGGAVIVLLGGDVVMDALVSGGVRPVGPPMVISASDGHLVREIDGEPALTRLEAVLSELAPDERAAVQRGPLLGFPADTARRPPTPDELLVRPIVGVDPTRRAFVIGASTAGLQPTMRLVVRDPALAAASLRAAAAQLATRRGRARAADAGVWVWTCVGRGEAFFGAPDADLDAIGGALGGSVGGAFAQGEIGPVRGAPYLHAFSASVAVIRRRPTEDWD